MTLSPRDTHGPDGTPTTARTGAPDGTGLPETVGTPAPPAAAGTPGPGPLARQPDPLPQPRLLDPRLGTGLPPRTARWIGRLVPLALGVGDALLVNGVTLGLELNVSLVAAAVLPFRHRFPFLVFLATLPGILIGYVWFAPLIALYTVALHRPRAALLVVSGLLMGTVHFIPWPMSDLEPTAYRDNALTLTESFMNAVTPIAMGLLVRTRRELAGRLSELTRSRRQADELIAQQVLSAERARLAREMHDVVAHQVSLISLQAGAVQISAEDARAREGARTIRELSVRTLDELRHMVGILRAADGEPVPLAPPQRLADLPRLIEVSALEVEYEAAYEEARKQDRAVRPEALERAAFRVVQEALTNIRKHAPGARVRIRVEEAETAVRPDARRPETVRPEEEPGGGSGGGSRRTLSVEVRNGPPDASAPPTGLPGGGHGLLGLRERAQLLGGTLDAHPTDDGGFVVRADFPVPS